MRSPVEKELREKLERLSNLPSIPQVIGKIRQISENPKSTTADLANAILSDHQLTTRILRMANSVYYAEFPGTVSTITHAIVLMGFRAVRNIAMSTAVYGAINKLSKRARFDVTAFWTRSLTTGVIAKQLAQMTRQRDMIEAAFIAGFIHDIGQIILAGVFPEKYEDISRSEAEDLSVHKLERALMGIDHLEVGEYVARKWNLPQALIQAMAQHHRLDIPPGERAENILTDIVYIADRMYALTNEELDVDSPEFRSVAELSEQLLGITPPEAARVYTESPRMVQSIAADLGVEIEEEERSEVEAVTPGDLNLDPAELDRSADHESAQHDRPAAEESAHHMQTSEDLTIESEFGRQKITDIEVNEISQKLEYKDAQLHFLQAATTALAEADTDDEALQIVCESIYRGLNMGRVILFRHDESKRAFVGRVGFGVESQEEVYKISFPDNQGMFDIIRKDGKVVCAAALDQKLYGDLEVRKALKGFGVQAFALVPIKILNETRFALFVECPEAEQPVEDDAVKSIVSLASQAGLTLERNLFKSRSGQ